MNIFTEIKLLMQLNKLASQFKELATMKLTTNSVLQGLALVVQGAVNMSGYFPAKAQVVITLGVTIVQAIIGLIAHFSNTNGTPQSQANPPLPDVPLPNNLGR